MFSVGIDVSKGASTVCVLKPYGEVVRVPFEVEHTKASIKDLKKILNDICGDTRIVMEATGHYHLPILHDLTAGGFFVCVVNPLVMKRFSSSAIRKGKTDKIDALKIAQYGIQNWHLLKRYEAADDIYEELSVLSRQYYQYVSIKVKCKITLNNLLDKVMPGIVTLIKDSTSGKDKLCSFVDKYWHYVFGNIKLERMAA